MEKETQVAGHYTSGRLEKAIFDALAQTSKDTTTLTANDLVAVDEFHVGGIEATKDLAAQMNLSPGLRLLDVGCGIGGPARYFASEHGCRVDGIDLTAEFISVAQSLTRLVKLDHLVTFQQASALDLPFAPATFDAAYMLHVGMNIAGKRGLYRELRRVLKPGSLLVVFDIMRAKDGPIQYPVPWALGEETSFVAGPNEYREALLAAGFRVLKERGRGAFGVEFSEHMLARMTPSGPPALGLHLLMGEKTPMMLKNILAMMRDGLLEPVEFFALAA